jgi:hypothetical protein
MEYSEIIKGRHVILTENGMYEPRYSLMYKGRIDEQLDTFINQRPTKIMDVASMEGANNISLSQYSGGDGGAPIFYTSCKLKKLRINTTYEVIHSKDLSGVEDGLKWISPTFSERRGGQTYTLDWIVPSAIELYITFEGSFGEDAFRPSTCYLHCRVDPNSFNEIGSGGEMPKAAKGWFTLPTGNVYEDGRLCFGPNLERAPSIIDATRRNIDLFYSTPWNSDLLENRDHTIKMFRFDETNNTQLVPLGMPHELMRSFHNTVLERAPIHDHHII